MNMEDIVVHVVVLNGCELVGRMRLQKTVYLLDRCGAEFGLQYTYHYYGPYSFDLAGACASATADERIRTVEKISGYYGVPYAIFKSNSEEGKPQFLGKLSLDKARSFLNAMKGVSDTVLEIAATIVFLRDEWNYYRKGTVGAIDELKRRKSLKATEERIEQALALLRDLGLWENEKK